MFPDQAVIRNILKENSLLFSRSIHDPLGTLVSKVLRGLQKGFEEPRGTPEGRY